MHHQRDGRVRKLVRDLIPAALVLAVAIAASCSGTGKRVKPPGEPASENQAPTGTTSTPAYSAYQHFLRAKYLEYDGEYARAASQLELALAFDGESAQLHHQLGRLSIVLNKPAKALRELKHAARLSPDWPEPLYLMGDIAFTQGRMDEARDLLDRVLVLKPNHGPAIKRRGEIAFLKEGLTGMTRHYEGVVESNPNDAFAWAVLAKLYQQQQEYDKLEKSLARFLELDPENPLAIEQLSSWYDRTRRFDQAIALFERLRGLVPHNPLISLKRGEFYLRAGKLEEAAKNFEEAKAFDISDDQMAMRVGFAYIEAERYDDAEREFRAIAKREKDGPGLFFLAWTLFQKKTYRRALKIYRRIGPANERFFLSAQFDSARCRYKLRQKRRADRRVEALLKTHRRESKIYRLAADYYRWSERLPKAIDALTRGLEELGDDVSLLYLKGTLLEVNERSDEALTTMKHLLAIDPEHADALNFVGYTYAERGERLDEAEAMIRRALRQKPEEGYIIDSLGWVFYRRGDYDEAVRWLLLASMIEPDEQEILLHLALALKAQGERDDKLRETLEKAAALIIEDRDILQRYEESFPELWPPLRKELAPESKK